MDRRRVLTTLRFVDRIPEVFRCWALAEDSWKLIAGYVGLSRVPLPFDVRLRNGLQYRLEELGDLETFWEVYFHTTYRVRSTDRVIVDAGANIGLFSCYAASRLPDVTVFAVEPIPATYARLVEHVRRNGLRGRIHTFNVALGSSSGNVRMIASGSASQNFCVVQPEAVSGETLVRVPAVPLGQFLERIPAETIDLLKMDIEGSEYDVLLSSTRHDLARIRRMDLEYHVPPAVCGASKEDLLRHLLSCGFTRIDHTGAEDYGKYYLARTPLVS